MQAAVVMQPIYVGCSGNNDSIRITYFRNFCSEKLRSNILTDNVVEAQCYIVDIG